MKAVIHNIGLLIAVGLFFIGEAVFGRYDEKED